MRLSLSLLAATLALAMIGCDDGEGSRSGVDSSKYLDEMSAAEIEQFCSWTASILEPGERTCPSGLTSKTYTASECVERNESKPPPHCLVSLAEDCLNSVGGDPCNIFATEACLKYIACATPKASTGTTDN